MTRCCRCRKLKPNCEFRVRRGSASNGGRTCDSCAQWVQVYDANRRDPSGGTLTHEEWRTLLEHYGGCVYCDGPAEVLDHRVPLDRGGRTESANVVPCCASCNGAKGRRSEEEFRAGLWPCAECGIPKPKEKYSWYESTRDGPSRNHGGRCVDGCIAAYWRRYRAKRTAAGRSCK